MSELTPEQWIGWAKDLASESLSDMEAIWQAAGMQAALNDGIKIVSDQAAEIERLRRERETLAAAVMAWEEYRNAALGSIAEVEAVAKLREAHTKALALLEGGGGA